MSRRRAIGLLGATGGAAMLAGCASNELAPSTGGTSMSGSSSRLGAPAGPSASCVAYARETNGPYPADGTNRSRGGTSNVLSMESFQRSDIRTSLIGSSTQVEGVKTELSLALVDVNNGCAPLVGHAVYMWHCDADGRYSLYDLPDESYLRGVLVSDANGQVTFTTIFPGCYMGRYPHIHFEVFSSLENATSGNHALLISQLAMPAEACNDVYANSSIYGRSLSRFAGTSITRDNVFGDNSTAQMSAMTLSMSGSAASGYSAMAIVGLAT